MGSFSIWHWLVVLVIVLVLFGKGKISGVMGELAQGVKAFKKGMQDDTPSTDGLTPDQPKVLENTASVDATKTDTVKH